MNRQTDFNSARRGHSSRPVFSVAILALTSLAATHAGRRHQGVQPIAFDQPQIEMMLQPSSRRKSVPGRFGLRLQTVQHHCISRHGLERHRDRARRRPTHWDVPRTPGVTFEDVAIGGGTKFAVSHPVNVRSGRRRQYGRGQPGHVSDGLQPDLQFLAGANRSDESFASDPASEALDIAGMPVMMGKTVVMDPKPLKQTWLSGADENVHLQSRHAVRCRRRPTRTPAFPRRAITWRSATGTSIASRTTTPAGIGARPTQNHNPFIGPNPVRAFEANPPVDNTPPVTIGLRRSPDGGQLPARQRRGGVVHFD